MKTLVIFFLFGIWLLPAVSRASEMINFSIDKDLYNSLSYGQQKNIENKISELASFFDEDIYPKIPAHILSRIIDLKVIIYFSNESARDGLFIPSEKTNGPHKIIVQLMQLNSNGLKALLAHEFFHAVHYEINPGEEAWVREGMAQAFEYLVTQEMNGINLQAARSHPGTPLIGVYDIKKTNPAQYGHDMLYFYYLYSHCGQEQMFWKLLEGSGNQKGVRLINAILNSQQNSSPECKSFEASAVSFEVAKQHNQIQHLNQKNSDRFFIAPVDIAPEALTVNSSAAMGKILLDLPFYSSIKVKSSSWMKTPASCDSCLIFYGNRSFPYDVSEKKPLESLEDYDVIIVKSPSKR